MSVRRRQLVEVDLVRKYVIRLHEEDPEFVEAGCAGVCRLLARLIPDARVVYGIADGTPHAWLSIKGQHVDPITLGGGPRYTNYREDRSAIALLDGETYGWTSRKVRRLLEVRASEDDE